jgi:hypothetical protein
LIPVWILRIEISKGICGPINGKFRENGIDDDHNGYVDDLHGWNFLGGKNGKSTISRGY